MELQENALNVGTQRVSRRYRGSCIDGPQWNCRNCGALLGVDAKRRLAIAFIGAPFVAFGTWSLFHGHLLRAAILLAIWVWIWTYDAVKCVGSADVYAGEVGVQSRSV